MWKKGLSRIPVVSVESCSPRRRIALWICWHLAVTQKHSCNPLSHSHQPDHMTHNIQQRNYFLWAWMKQDKNPHKASSATFIPSWGIKLHPSTQLLRVFLHSHPALSGTVHYGSPSECHWLTAWHTWGSTPTKGRKWMLRGSKRWSSTLALVHNAKKKIFSLRIFILSVQISKHSLKCTNRVYG